MIYDVAIAGGGPAGLALATHVARRGLSVALLERGELPADKACGEGLMPSGVHALERLGVLFDAASCAPFEGIRYVQEDGAFIEGTFADGRGLGIRRTALSAALVQRARSQGAALFANTAVRTLQRAPQELRLRTDSTEVRARVLVAADGLHSPLRRVMGLDGAPAPVRRFGLRRHFRVAPWSSFVEVHFGDGAEAYVTPCGQDRVGVAFLWEHHRVTGRLSYDALLRRFPALQRRLEGAPADSRPMGAGAFWTRVRRRTSDRFVLLGDAAGYVDALTGEGVSLALHGAEVLARILPDALTRGATERSLQSYERDVARAFARYERLTRAVLFLARTPRLRRTIVSALRRTGGFERLLRLGTGWAAPRA